MKKLTDTATIKKNLVVASLFVTASEMLRSSIEEKISGFLCEVTDFDEKGGLLLQSPPPTEKQF